MPDPVRNPVSPADSFPDPSFPVRKRAYASFAAFLLSCALAAPGHADTGIGTPLPAAPDLMYGKLFVAVQSAKIYPDQKTFVDAIPKADPAVILRQYELHRNDAGFSLKAFVDQYFTPPKETSVTPPAGQGLREHINWLWPALTRTTASAPDNSSLIPLPKPYVVPGGRFREVYYWDSYFTMLGLEESGRDDLINNMLDNFAYQIDKLGHIPNGNRTYYVSRSQPPFFSLMVELASRRQGTEAYVRYLPQLRKEYAYWMRGLATTAPGKASNNVVVLADGTVLNRNWDDQDTPRPESYLQDVTTAREAPGRPAQQVWRDLRAAAASGWDFSSRWFGDNATLGTIRTTAILPVDLNSLLLHLETSIVKGCEVIHDVSCVNQYGDLATKRTVAINRYLWHPDGYYADYDWQLGKVRANQTAAMLFPLFINAAPPDRAQQTLARAQSVLLQADGLATTTYATKQQWDAPNGWAPLQWVAVVASKNYSAEPIARAVGTRFLGAVKRVYGAERKLVEKYVVDGSATGGGGGGEYPLQDGFGWTNGVTLKLLDAYDSRQ
jgi:alpha,alpha-trehalase